MAPTYRSKVQRKPPRQNAQRSVTEEEPPRRPDWDTESDWSSDYEANRHAYHEPLVISQESPGRSSDDAPLARLLRPSAPPTTSGESESNDSGPSARRPPSDRPRRRTQQPTRLEYDRPGKPAWHWQHCVTCGAIPTRGYKY